MAFGADAAAFLSCAVARRADGGAAAGRRSDAWRNPRDRGGPDLVIALSSPDDGWPRAQRERLDRSATAPLWSR